MNHIIGKGDLSREFCSFAKIDNECLFYDVDQIDSQLITKYKPGEKIFIAIANGSIRKNAFNELLKYNLTPSKYIHSSVIIGNRSTIGKGSIIQPNSIISSDVDIGQGVFLNCNSIIGHDSKVEDFSSIMANVNVGGHCFIDKYTFIGTGAIIIPKIKIGQNITVGAGAVVVRKLKLPGTYFGNPSKKIN